MVDHLIPLHGLSSAEVPALQEQYGSNTFKSNTLPRWMQTMIGIVREPMFILLIIACVLYFVLGNIAGGILMSAALVLVAAISVYQETRSARALKLLRQYIEPKVKVIRDGIEILIDSPELVPGDVIVLEEGMKIPADAMVLQSNDFTADESIITGESMPVDKNSSNGNRTLYQGTTVNSGKCLAVVTATGNRTELGRIGKTIEEFTEIKTLLQVQVNRFVARFAFFGFAGFIVIFVFNFFYYDDLVRSLLFALTVAMSVIPEEIPVAFSSFMALGAAKMGKIGIISRQPQVIENLGSMNVLCLDKTGTLTENRMQVRMLYDYKSDKLIDLDDQKDAAKYQLLWFAILASEQSPFDTMEKAIWEAYYEYGAKYHNGDLRMIREYPLEGKPPMMTHVYQHNGEVLAASKGGAETILDVSKINGEKRKLINQHISHLASRGFRVLGVASAIHDDGSFPEDQQDFKWQFEGLLALYDPPRSNASTVIKKVHDAGINIKLVTGDHAETAMTVAQQTGFLNPLRYRTGDEVMEMSEDALKTTAKTTNVFARMYPEAKLKLVNALRADGNIVGMTGDGVNDGPALKAADIGIAMGKKGTETARRAADLVLSDDNLEHIAIAISEGRRIFSNLVKAIRYIIAIHIPIILTASLPLLLGWKYPNIFSPVHVIFLELIMAPTCSIFYEREPVDQSLMQSRPRSLTTGLFTAEELLMAIVQGLVITAGVLSIYYIFMNNGYSIELTRTVVFTTLLIANIFLTFTNRSFTRTMWYTFRYRNNLAPVVLIVSISFLAILHFVPVAKQLFELASITATSFWICFIVAFCSVMWFEVYKTGLRKLLEKL